MEIKAEIYFQKNTEINIRLNGQTLHSKFNPFMESERILEGLLKEAGLDSSFYFYGGAALYLVRALLQNLKYKGKKIAVFEPVRAIREDESIQQIVIELYSIAKSRNIQFQYFLSPEDGIEFLKGIRYRIWAYPFYSRNFAVEYRSFQEKILAGNPDINRSTKNHFRRVWLRSYFVNMKFCRERLVYFPEQLGPMSGERDFIFAGASPILEESIETLRKHAKRSFLAVSDTAAYFLHKKGIQADLVISIDSGRGTLYHFRKDFPADIPVLSWMGGSSGIFRMPNPICLFASTYPLDQILHSIDSRLPFLENPSLNTAGIAKAFAEFSGFRKIVYYGVGFTSYKYKSHCRGTGYEVYQLPFLNRKQPLETKVSGVYKKEVSNKNKISLQEISKSDQGSIIEFAEPGSDSDSLLNKNSIKERLVLKPFEISRIIPTLLDHPSLENALKVAEVDKSSFQRYSRFFL